MIAFNFYIHTVVKFRIAIHNTMNKLGFSRQLIVIQDVIFGDRINGDRGVGVVVDVH
ncbi:hypothetical protein D3C73_1579400 [compost metagenome]